MRLYLVRHGEACGPEVNPQRPLTDRGKVKVQNVADFLAASGISVSQIYHSGKLRAQQTAEIFAKTIAPRQKIKILAQLDSSDVETTLTDQIKLWDEDILIVGHIPLLPRLTAKLLVNDEDKLIIDFQPTSVLCLQRIDHEKWVVDWMLAQELFKRRSL